ncbi:MAG: sugar ABC transporter substrate-binding protein [Dorea sp.]|jgi:ABC-type sugar transport system substrate-binding protein|nr:sugar ABC transporter substrate-binding protein [Dorea sp.]GFI43539.1 ribose import binding protein RbsB [Lachnospiraceae bacterium]
MRKRKMVRALLMLVCIFVLSACKKNVGTPEDNAVSDESSETEELAEDNDTYVFGFSGIDMENPYFITLESAIREVIEKEGYELITKDPASNPKDQEAQIEEMIREGIDGIFLCPVDWEAITPVLDTLKEANVRIINVDTQVKEMDYVDAYIGSNNVEAGYVCGEDLIERCPEGGKVAILECPTQNSINDRITGFEEAIAAAAKGFEVVERVDTNGEFEKALEAAKEILEKYPDVSAIMCGNDQLAVAAKTAVNLANLKTVVIYGVDGSPDIKKELKKADGQIAGTAAQSPINIGKTAAKTAVAMLNGEDYEREIFEEVFMIDKDNVEMYGVDGWQ